jgi:hypothetical protein
MNFEDHPESNRALIAYLERGRQFIEGVDGVEHTRKINVGIGECSHSGGI